MAPSAASEKPSRTEAQPVANAESKEPRVSGAPPVRGLPPYNLTNAARADDAGTRDRAYFAGKTGCGPAIPRASSCVVSCKFGPRGGPSNRQAVVRARDPKLTTYTRTPLGFAAVAAP